jgi:hypothetical protein
MNGKLSQVFDTWRNQTERQMNMKQLTHKIVSRMMNCTLFAAYFTWKDHSSHQRHMEGVCSRIVGRMMSRTIASAFLTWQDNSSHQRHMEDVCSRIVGRMMSRSSGNAFEAWLESSIESSFFRRKMLKACLVWSSKSARKNFQLWYQTVNIYKHFRRIDKLTVRKVGTRALHKIWFRWVTLTIRERRLRRGITRLIARLGNKQASRAIAGWASNSKDLRQRRKMLSVALRNIRFYLAHKTWRAWQVKSSFP